MEILGSGYVIDNYISVFHKEHREQAYRIYVTDALKVISENTTRQFGGASMKVRFAEMILPQKVETRTEEEVINDITEKLRKV